MCSGPAGADLDLGKCLVDEGDLVDECLVDEGDLVDEGLVDEGLRVVPAHRRR